MTQKQRLRIQLSGAVQGVGFRPRVYRLATELDLKGWVLNSTAGLALEVEGPPAKLEEFATRLEREQPAAAVVLGRRRLRLAAVGYTQFQIRPSSGTRPKTAAILPDLATCAECRRELLDPTDRRFGYAFTNCTNCGPRYTIVEDLPYDRPNTTLRGFAMCPECLSEYTDPRNRRFHAQPNACPRCGPCIESAGIESAARALREGRIVALKGMGGFQLLADATQIEAVARLRERKAREQKPFGMMMRDIETVRRFCHVSPADQELLESRAAPIVLLKPNGTPGIAPNVAGGSPYYGVMLPCSPLHHLLLRECGLPLVATSGNRSDETIAFEDQEARERLGGIADGFLTHNRPIARPCDDSVVRLTRGRETILRRARGYAPLPVRVTKSLPAVLAVGGHLKNTVAIARGTEVYLSQHIGDLEAIEARQAFERAIADLCRLYDFTPELVACDLHPDYASTQWAQRCGMPVIRVQHHQAHVAACAAENGVEGPYLGVAWDGSGYGTDGTVWGGEFFLVEQNRFERVAHLRPFRLIGSQAAVREGCRVAAAFLGEVLGAAEIEPAWRRMLERGIHSPWTTSVGRLFDGVASIAGVAQRNCFEGQAAMALEWAIGPVVTDETYPLPDGDWEPLIREVLADLRNRTPAALIAARFHNALVDWIVSVAEHSGVRQVALSGGVFQNRYLVERAAARLEARGLTVYTHRQVPPNDGGIALGQAVLAGASLCA